MSNQQVITKPGEVPDFLAKIPGIQVGSHFPDLGHSRILLVGRPKVGKSTLLHGYAGAYVDDPERAGGLVSNPRCVRFGPYEDASGRVITPTFSDHKKAHEALFAAHKAGKNKRITTIGLDTVDSLLELRMAEFCAEKKLNHISEYSSHSGNGYSICYSDVIQMIDDIEKAGFGWVAIAHLAPKTVRGTEGDIVMTQITLPEKVLSFLHKRCDHFFGMTEKSVPNMVKKMLPGGKEVEIQAGLREVRVLEAAKIGGRIFKAGQLEGAGSRINFPEEIEISSDNGWADLDKVYRNSIGKVSE